MKRLLTPLLLLSLCFLLSFAPTDPLYQDVYFAQTNDQFVFGNQRTELRFDAKTGEWVAWTQERPKLNLLGMSANEIAKSGFPALDFSIDGEYLVAKHGATVLSHSVAVDKDRRGATLSITMGVSPQNGSYAYDHTLAARAQRGGEVRAAHPAQAPRRR
ncbi:MAG: hypothetical protein EAZ91_00625 [Cytophagales bacterium]|nr:MAG: hypothetical protein EAZ91_00625 [Cytophagales bacterium]